MRLNQVTLPAVDVQACADFYRRLGFRQIVDSLPDYVRFECPEGEATLSIERVDQPSTPPGIVLYLEIRSLDETVDQLQQQGLVFDQLPTDQPWLWREARLRDPAGNVLCLYWAGENRRFPPWRLPP